MNYFINLAGAGSQMLNAVFAGDKDQTFSSRCYQEAVVNKKRRWLLPYWLINVVFFVLRWVLNRVIGSGPVMPRNHCKDAYQFDTERT